MENRKKYLACVRFNTYMLIKDNLTIGRMEEGLPICEKHEIRHFISKNKTDIDKHIQKIMDNYDKIHSKTFGVNDIFLIITNIMVNFPFLFFQNDNKHYSFENNY